MSTTAQITTSATGGSGSTASGTHRVEEQLQFLAQSLVVNNYTNQWVFLPDPNLFVPPYTLGFTVSMSGSRRLLARVSGPTGIPQSAVIVGQRCVLEAFEVALPPSAGQTITVRAPSTEWRNPIGLSFSSAGEQTGPMGFVADWIYTVPAGRRARVDSAQVYTELVVSDGSGSRTLVQSTISIFPGGGAGTNYIEADIYNGTVVGARADSLASSNKELQAGDIVAGEHNNLRGAGVISWNVETASITEGDA